MAYQPLAPDKKDDMGKKMIILQITIFVDNGKGINDVFT
jgi:hypothetical protein